MSIRCWDVHDQIANAFVVYAHNPAGAVSIANKHLGSFGGNQSSDMTAIERLPGVTGCAAQHLIAALGQGDVGIGHLQQSGSWSVLPPGLLPATSVAAASTQMHHYRDDEDYQVVLFAHDELRADELYHAISFNDHRDLPAEWLGSEWEAWTTVGLVRHQRQAEERGIEGVGVYTKQGWQIFPLDYGAFRVDPPDRDEAA
jgi:hypothetical protein